MPKRALLVCVAAVAAFGLPALPVSASPSPSPAATSAPPGTYESCPAPKAAGQMQCQSVVRASAVKPMGVQPAAAPDGYGPADLRSAYALPSDTAGDGQTVAIVDAYDAPNAEADLGVYRAQYGLPPCTSDNGCLTRVDQRGGTQWPAYDAGWAGEVALDLEMVSAVCPKCHLLLVEADTASDDDLYAAEDRAISMGARFVSNSWSGGESPDQMQAGDPHFDHPGVAITASSGDSGFPGGYPATSQYVTAVGGTSLVRDAGTSRGWSETAWQRAGSTCSPWEPAPSFQTQDMTDCGKRATSDVSAVADPATGVAVYDRGWQVYGGTSVSAPIVAATYALAGAPLTGSSPNALPYQHPEALNDVTSGNNGCQFKFCQAGPGWDGPTGLGTPNGIGAFSPGPHGELVGTVTDGLGAPVADATVTAGGQQVTSGADGRFAFTLPPGHYDVVTSKFGYKDATRAVDLADGQTLTANVRLLVLPQETVSGTVRDGSGHGWPIYASVQVHGQPTTRVFTDPRTGAYQLRLPRDAAYDLDIAPVYHGYEQATKSVTLGRDPVVADVSDPVTFASCDAAGYEYTTTPVSTETFDNPTTPAGWSLVDSLGRGLLWSFDDPGARGNLTGGSGGFAIVDSDHANPSQFQDTSLVSPAWDLSGLTHPALSFHTDYFGMSNERATVELSVNGGATWTQLWIHQTDSVRGPNLQTIDLSQWAGQPSVQVRFRYQSYATWWWQVDDVSLGERSCSPTPGGLVLGEVTDKNTGSGLTGASVTSSALATSTVATPDDAALGEGFYWTFAKPGSYALHATQPGGYQPVAATVQVADNAVTSTDFALPAGRIAVTPADLTASVDLGGHRTQTVKVTNTGSAPATVALHDVPGGVAAPASRGPATQRISGTYRPGPASKTLSARVATTDAVPQAAPWVTSADFPIPIADNAMATDDGKVYSAGGASSNGAPLPRLYRYDPDAMAWTRLADMPAGRDYPQAAFLDGKLYVAGGWDTSDSGLTDTMEVYDPATDTWSAGPKLPTAVAAAGVAVLDNRMYVIGGCPSFNNCGTAAVQVYDPALDRWESGGDLPAARLLRGMRRDRRQAVLRGRHRRPDRGDPQRLRLRPGHRHLVPYRWVARRRPVGRRVDGSGRQAAARRRRDRR